MKSITPIKRLVTREEKHVGTLSRHPGQHNHTRHGSSQTISAAGLWTITLAMLLLSCACTSLLASESGSGKTRGWWPQGYSVTRDETAGKLTVATSYYTFVHDLKRGGVLERISLAHGQATNLLVTPMQTTISLLVTNAQENTDAAEEIRRVTGTFSDSFDPAPVVTCTKSGELGIVTVVSALRNERGQDSGIRVKTTYAYHWGYVKIHREYIAPPAGVQVRNLTVLSTIVAPSLTDYGHRPGAAEEMGADFNAWQCGQIRQWGKIRPGAQLDLPFQTRYIPRYLVLANPGVEGIEWFAADDLSQWDFQMSGQTGTSYCKLGASTDPLGISVAICPFSLSSRYELPKGGWVAFKGSLIFDYYLGVPILEGHANQPWLDRGFQANGGKWVSEAQIRTNAEAGITTMRLHNDGDGNGDGLFWRDGSYPPYPPAEMKKMDKVIETCHRYGIKVAPYFSNHELNQSTPEFKAHGEEWGRKVDDQGNLRPNFYYGALMCLKSGWSDFFKLSVDRVLTNHAFDGVYYDWNLAMYCNNPLHVGQTNNGVSDAKQLGALAISPTGHWDIDEFLELVEWTRHRVGPDGLVLLHNTLVPMFATENFANSVVGMEFTYGQLSVSMPKPVDLPLEWNFAGARSRTVIGYGTMDDHAPRRLHRDYALTALLTSVAPWPATDEYLQFSKILKPLGNLEQYKFEDGRNQAVKLEGAECLSAVYSRAGEAYVLVANLGPDVVKVRCAIDSKKLPYPMPTISKAKIFTSLGTASPLNARDLSAKGRVLSIPPDDIVMLHVE